MVTPKLLAKVYLSLGPCAECMHGLIEDGAPKLLAEVNLNI